MGAWHERDAFWVKWAPFLFGEQRWQQTPQEVTEIVSLLGIAPGAAVLDLCCGPGRHSLELARRVFAVTGVDVTRAYLDQAGGRAEAEGLSVEFIEEDMRAFRRPESFDAAINVFTSFGYFEDIEDDRRVAANVYLSLKEGGAFLIDLMGKEVLARIFQERHWSEVDGALVLQELRVCRDWSWIENRWIMIGDGESEEYSISHRLYSAAELKSLLTGCGFDAVEAYGSLSGTPYDTAARRLVIVARKGEA